MVLSPTPRRNRAAPPPRCSDPDSRAGSVILTRLLTPTTSRLCSLLFVSLFQLEIGLCNSYPVCMHRESDHAGTSLLSYILKIIVPPFLSFLRF